MFKPSLAEIIGVKNKTLLPTFFEFGKASKNYVANLDNAAEQGQVLSKHIPSAHEDKEGICIVSIDNQNDFMDDGRLAVQGAYSDTERLCLLMIKGVITGLTIGANTLRIRSSVFTGDKHRLWAIHTRYWWVDKNGIMIPPNTPITLDTFERKWFPVTERDWSKHYLQELKRTNQPDCMAWATHCPDGEYGSNQVPLLEEVIYWLSAARLLDPTFLDKGKDPKTDQYGAFEPCVDTGDPNAAAIKAAMLGKIAEQKNTYIIFAGQALDFCYKTSMEQTVDYFHDRPDVLERILFVEGLTSPVFPQNKKQHEAFKQKMRSKGVKIVRYEDLMK